MTHTYNITGMTCGGCVAKAKSALLKIGDINEATLQLTSPQATVSMTRHIPVSTLQHALNNVGAYTITEIEKKANPQPEVIGGKPSWLMTYKPIILIGAYIIMITLLVEMRHGFDIETWMQHFMAGFFIVFSFFKMLDLKGFADSYATYDVIAKKWHAWGYVYAFIELTLGVSYLLKFNPILTNAATFIVMSISLFGVLQAVYKKQKIRCACLGTVFNLPMSTVTIIEDALMICMSFVMLLV